MTSRPRGGPSTPPPLSSSLPVRESAPTQGCPPSEVAEDFGRIIAPRSSPLLPPSRATRGWCGSGTDGGGHWSPHAGRTKRTWHSHAGRPTVAGSTSSRRTWTACTWPPPEMRAPSSSFTARSFGPVAPDAEPQESLASRSMLRPNPLCPAVTGAEIPFVPTSFGSENLWTATCSDEASSSRSRRRRASWWARAGLFSPQLRSPPWPLGPGPRWWRSTWSLRRSRRRQTYPCAEGPRRSCRAW